MQAKLNEKQKRFCEYYALNMETLANGVQSYALAYGYDLSDKNKYKSAKANAHKLLSNEAINKYISELLQEKKLTPELIDSQLDFLILQNANLGVKLQAIGLYYKVHSKIAEPEQKIDLSKTAMTLAARYMDQETWNTKYSKHFSSQELVEMQQG